ncbi:hypothetical protein EGM87_22870 [Sphingobium sp. RSMS]|uniref:hypothetical protein n=1 Tax=Sphingobium sp. RSMS TaxID=520734 RepID=UPI0010F6C98A|nr:hypothetical protein [Sphingobium sp. RSMS]UXC93142.1 hypothetical protein EGM87_22870 [Sphingobium sp. RSMS]
MTAALAIFRRFWPALAVAAVLALILLLVRCSDRAQDSAVEQARDAGASEVREQAATSTLTRTLEAINAEEAVRHDPAVRDAACLRHARNPEDC